MIYLKIIHTKYEQKFAEIEALNCFILKKKEKRMMPSPLVSINSVIAISRYVLFNSLDTFWSVVLLGSDQLSRYILIISLDTF